MSCPWYEQGNLREEILVFGRAIQGVAPYDIIIEPDHAKCHGGCCSFDDRLIVVNPTLFDTPPEEQFTLTKGLLVHEAGHKRFTTPSSRPVITRKIANIMEDERVERLMCEEFIGVRWMVQRLAERFYQKATPINPNSDESYLVVSYFLMLRWAKRIGKPVRGNLSKKNQLLWKQVEPLVYDAWQAENSLVVDQYAIVIAEILGFNELININRVGGRINYNPPTPKTGGE